MATKHTVQMLLHRAEDDTVFSTLLKGGGWGLPSGKGIPAEGLLNVGRTALFEIAGFEVPHHLITLNDQIPYSYGNTHVYTVPLTRSNSDFVVESKTCMWKSIKDLLSTRNPCGKDLKMTFEATGVIPPDEHWVTPYTVCVPVIRFLITDDLSEAARLHRRYSELVAGEIAFHQRLYRGNLETLKQVLGTDYRKEDGGVYVWDRKGYRVRVKGTTTAVEFHPSLTGDAGLDAYAECLREIHASMDSIGIRRP
jgi:hypothetical protein